MMLHSKISRRNVLAALGPLAAATAVAEADVAKKTVERWDVLEIALPGPDRGNPFIDVQLSAEFRIGNRVVHASGFYDGDGQFRVRFMPDMPGEWSYVTRSNTRELNGRTGSFTCIAAEGNNHGPVTIRDPHHFCYADGTPHVSIGTTCYAWAHQPASIEKRTLETLQSSPFNKLRMCILPTEKNPARFPFERDAMGQNDFTQFNVKFFQHLDSRIRDLRALGIEADLILFHPYDQLGYGDMPPDANYRYLRYVVARFSAYRNVWWSIANEYDLVKTKHQPEWDDFFRIVQQSDPYGHLRSIHYSKVLYDYSKPWVTHLSMQSDAFDNTQQWSAEYQKPVVFDECKYEGDIDKRWGNLSGLEMMRRFWLGMTAGAYVGHGETYHDPKGTAWIAKGGKLLGESPARIAFLRRVFEEAPVHELEPMPEPYYPCIFKQNEYYLYFFDLHQPIEYEFQMPESVSFSAELLDPWEMTITQVPGSHRGKFTLQLPGKPYQAIRFRRA